MLHAAAEGGDKDTVLALLEKKADATAKNWVMTGVVHVLGDRSRESQRK